jgi:Zn-dependent peptidase ImmA (M78 family)
MRDEALIKALAGCASAETLLAVILQHRPDLAAPMPVDALAESLGITGFGDLDGAGATSALVADAAKILTAASLTPQRRRFAIAHQLGHFLLQEHGGERRCTHRDLLENRRNTPARKEEMQANRFASGLLMPKPLFVASVAALGKPMVTHLPTLAAAYDVPLEAAASRYADLSLAMCALIFVKDGAVRLARSSRTFPPLAIHPGAPAPPAITAAGPSEKIAWSPAEVRDWLTLSRDTRPPKLTLQTLTKPNGFQLVLLSVNAGAERRADEEDEKDATERPKFGRPRTR